MSRILLRFSDQTEQLGLATITKALGLATMTEILKEAEEGSHREIFKLDGRVHYGSQYDVQQKQCRKNVVRKLQFSHSNGILRGSYGSKFS